MALTRNQQRMIGVLGVSLVGLLVDRVVLSPGTASAGPDLLVKPGERTGAPGETPTIRNPHWGAKGLQQRLLSATRPMAEQEVVLRDVFFPRDPEPVTVTEPQATSRPVETPVSKLPTPQELAAEFAARHKLRALVVSATTRTPSMAIIDDRLVRIGEGIGGFRLVGLEAKAAIFESTDHPAPFRVRLTISDAVLIQ